MIKSRWWAIVFLGIFLFLVGFTLKLKWDPVAEADGYRIFVRLEGQQYDYKKPIWDSSIHGTKEKVEYCELSETIDPAMQAFPIPGEIGDHLFLIARAFKHPTEACPEGTESEDSNEVDCFYNTGGCTKIFVFPPKNLTVQILGD